MESIRDRVGHFVTSTTVGEVVKAYVPRNLPLAPPLDMPRLDGLLAKANQQLGRLDAFAELLPDVDLFIYYYIRKEAVLSSQIEGTQSSEVLP